MSETLVAIRTATLRRLGDVLGEIWSDDEIDAAVREGYRELALAGRAFVDHTFAENLPAGFTVTAAVDQGEAAFAYGIVANYTLDDERRLVTPARAALGPANHTSPFEATDGWLDDCGASTAIPATVDLPAPVTEIERGTWDGRTLTALDGRQLAAMDTRYQLTRGEVYGFLWRHDGVRTLRKVRVPARAAACHTINGSVGILRDPSDLSSDIVTGARENGAFDPLAFAANAFDDDGILRGFPARIPGEHPIGTESFGIPRRPYRDGTNVRLEHWREGRAIDTPADVCELPARYSRYLQDYAQWRALLRPGPGQDLALAGHYQVRWARGLARVQRRQQTVERERVGVFGGTVRQTMNRPPKPQLPWQFGSRVR